VATTEATPHLLHEFFVRAATRWPDRTAVEVPPGHGREGRRSTTYAELDRESDALAGRLRTLVFGECVVAILLPRTSAHLYAAQLAVLKAGAAYACIEPSFPDERVRDILADAHPVALLTDHAGLARASHASFHAPVVLDVTLDSGPSQDGVKPPWLTPAHLAYVIYTSGTTGHPKGVMIEHRSIANLVGSDLDAFRLSPDDRVVQNSSAAYDSSIEETWLAFAAGATVVVMDDAAARLGPDLIGWLQRERITVFCPPPTLLRATGCDDPAAALPGLSLVYVGGEALPQDIADRWARGRRLVNGYGPTECAVTALRAPVLVGERVSIGRPVPGVQAWVVNESFDVLPAGERGELCLGGIALARGYWKQPELTTARFPTHPQLGRLYRTGDLVHQEPDGSLYFHGRIDAQVKLRGYRVELGAVESALAHCRGVRAAGCTVQDDAGRQTLVAFVVPSDPAAPPQAAALKEALRATLPPYMVPWRIGFLGALPTTVGGKLDRKALPHLDEPRPEPHAPRVPPRDAVETRLDEAFREVLRRAEGVSIHDDFFTDLGGDSLSAAELITLLREETATAALTVRDVYEARTVAELALRAGAATGNGTVPEDEPPRAVGRPMFATLVQSVWLAKSLLVNTIAAYVAAFVLLPALTATLGLVPLLLLAPLLILAALAAYVPLSVALAVAVKKLLIGRYEAVRAPVWGGFHLRNWIVQQTVKTVPWSVLEGTEFHNAALRALGARIGRRVHLHRGVHLRQGGWDLLDIGDDVTIGQDASIRLVELDDGQIVVGPVTIGSGCTLDVHAGVGAHSVLEPDAFLGARSSLPRGGRIPRGEGWDGIPARPAGVAPQPPALPEGGTVLSPHAAGLLLMAARLAIPLIQALPTELFAIGMVLAAGVDTDRALAWYSSASMEWHVLLAYAALAAVSVPIGLVMEALICRAMGRVPEGVSSRWSPGYLRIWLKPGMVDSAGRWLYGTLFWPYWLRLAGMKVGSDCEISGLIDTIPETVTIGAKTFCADGIYLAGPRVHRGTVTVRRSSLGGNTFLGNGVVIAAGQHLPGDILLGVCTVADEAAIRPATAWFGHPPFELPHREVVPYDPRFTLDPSPLRYVVRVFWELLRFAVPAAPALILAYWFKLLVAAEGALPWPAFLLGAVPLISAGAAVFFTVMVIGIKWSLLGRVRPGIHPLWSSWASRWDLVCLAWNVYAAELVSALDGTLMLNVLLRVMGVHIGRGVVLGAGFAGDLPDPDMLTFEDGATLDCLFQAHTFEDRVLKMDRITIRAGASVGHNAVLLYGADVGARTRVAPHSVVMKHEHLVPGQSYAGFPTRPMSDPGAW
jgi:non-ribosomal peptide synthetase-like protein